MIDASIDMQPRTIIYAVSGLSVSSSSCLFSHCCLDFLSLIPCVRELCMLSTTPTHPYINYVGYGNLLSLFKCIAFC